MFQFTYSNNAASIPGKRVTWVPQPARRCRTEVISDIQREEKADISNRCHALLFILLLIPFAISAQSKTSAVSPVFSLHLRPEKKSADTDGHLRIGIWLTNESDHKITVEIDTSHKGDFYYQVKARREDGSEPDKSDYHHALRGEPTTNPIIVQDSPFDVNLEPGKSIVDFIDLSELYDLAQPGKYTFQVQRTDPHTNSVVKSNVVTVTVQRGGSN
jgi:hypothetical protein